MIKNMGNTDRIIRTIIGAAALITAIVAGGWVWVAGVLGIVLLATSLVGTCPLYMPFGIRTNKARPK